MTNEYGFEIPLVSEEECKLQERIEELEQEKCELLGIIQGKDKVIKDLEWQLQEVAKDNDNYQKENAELKKKNLDTQDAVAMQMYTNKANKEIADRQLTKATKLLNEFMRIGKASDEDFEHDYSELIGEAEQFLKEIEK